MSGRNYVTRVFNAPDGLPAAGWNALLALEPDPSPFMRHEYLAALHTTGAAVAETGWQAQFITLWADDRQIGAGRRSEHTGQSRPRVDKDSVNVAVNRGQCRRGSRRIVRLTRGQRGAISARQRVEVGVRTNLDVREHALEHAHRHRDFW